MIVVLRSEEHMLVQPLQHNDHDNMWALTLTKLCDATASTTTLGGKHPQPRGGAVVGKLLT